MNIKPKPKLQPVPSVKCANCYYDNKPDCTPHRPYDCGPVTNGRFIIFKEVKPNGN